MEPFEWHRLLFGEDGSWQFLFEVGFRTVVMYLVLLVFFKLSGKRTISQLSVFELIVIVGLGSAAGDPMFYMDVPILYALTTFVVILSLYMLMNFISRRKHRFSVWLEGDTRCVFSNNRVSLKELAREDLGTEDLFSELRLSNVEHLGQVSRAYLEFTGRFSVFFRPDDEVDYGLPIQPEKLDTCSPHIQVSGTYSCVRCGNTRAFDMPAEKPVCEHCGFFKWVVSLKTKRIT